MFSFNTPYGACSACHGLGFKQEFDPDLIIPNKDISLMEGAVEVWNSIDVLEADSPSSF